MHLREDCATTRESRPSGLQRPAPARCLLGILTSEHIRARRMYLRGNCATLRDVRAVSLRRAVARSPLLGACAKLQMCFFIPCRQAGSDPPGAGRRRLHRLAPRAVAQSSVATAMEFEAIGQQAVTAGDTVIYIYHMYTYIHVYLCICVV